MKKRQIKKFLLTCLLRGMTTEIQKEIDLIKISTHMPLARHDVSCRRRRCRRSISTHMPLARHDKTCGAKKYAYEFLLTCLLRGMMRQWRLFCCDIQFLLTCLLRGMTDIDKGLSELRKISTHMPLARHDIANYYADPYLTISTHMPLARHDKKRSNRPHQP